MSHPLLTKVLADAMTRSRPLPNIDELAAGITPAIADRLEAALDVCSVCGLGHHDEHFPEQHDNHNLCHAFVPLVTP